MKYIFYFIVYCLLLSCNKETIIPYRQWNEISVYYPFYNNIEAFDTQNVYYTGEYLMYNGKFVIIRAIKPLN